MTTWIDLAGWTLLHFVWQGAVIAAAAAAGLRVLRRRSPQARYALAGAALVAMLAAPAITAVGMSADGPMRATSVAPTTGAGSPEPSRPVAPVSAPPAMTRPASASVTVEPLLPTVVIVWLSGVSLLLLRLTGGWWRVRRLHRLALEEPVSRWQAAADAIARQLWLARPVFIVDSIRIETPTVIGWLRPVILLPVAAMSNLTPAQVDAILAHELAHIRRHDFAINLLQTVAETLLFYHPAVWWISARLRVEREHCCDDVAVEVCGDAVAYASALTELAEWNLGGPPLAVTATGGSLTARVRRLLNMPGDGSPRSASGLLALGLVLGLVVVGGSVRAISVAQTVDSSGPDTSDRGFGPPDINRLLGYELFPVPKAWSIDDPRAASAWRVTINYSTGNVPLMGFTARSLIRHAYAVHRMPIVGMPEWADKEGLELAVASERPVAAGVADPDGMNAALRVLLEQQLGLLTHVETRDVPVYALVRDRADGTLGPQIAPSTAECFPGRMGGADMHVIRTRGQALQFCGVDNGLTGVRGIRVSMAEFVDSMRDGSPLRLDRPVVDRTGLPGEYDFRVRFGFLPVAAIGWGHPEFGKLIEPFGFRSAFTAFPEQLGLRLVASTAPFDVLVVDRIRRPPRG